MTDCIILLTTFRHLPSCTRREGAHWLPSERPWVSAMPRTCLSKPQLLDIDVSYSFQNCFLLAQQAAQPHFLVKLHCQRRAPSAARPAHRTPGQRTRMQQQSTFDPPAIYNFSYFSKSSPPVAKHGKSLGPDYKTHLSVQLRKLVKDGRLVLCKASYKV